MHFEKYFYFIFIFTFNIAWCLFLLQMVLNASVFIIVLIYKRGAAAPRSYRHENCNFFHNSTQAHNIGQNSTQKSKIVPLKRPKLFRVELTYVSISGMVFFRCNNGVAHYNKVIQTLTWMNSFQINIIMIESRFRIYITIW